MWGAHICKCHPSRYYHWNIDDDDDYYINDDDDDDVDNNDNDDNDDYTENYDDDVDDDYNDDFDCDGDDDDDDNDNNDNDNDNDESLAEPVVPVDGGEERGGEGTREDTEEDGEVPTDQGNRSNPTDGQTHLCWNKDKRNAIHWTVGPVFFLLPTNIT